MFAAEPHVPPALLAMDHVVLQPHQGSATVETRAAMADLVLANLDAQAARTATRRAARAALGLCPTCDDTGQHCRVLAAMRNMNGDRP